jgi:hypothetical protein
MPQTQYPQYQPAVPPPTHRRSLWDKIWKDKNGHVVIWQMPNVWIIGWAVLTTVSLFFIGRTADVISGVASVSLVVWSVLEILRGTNYFRRFLGLIVIIYAVAALIRTFT